MLLALATLSLLGAGPDYSVVVARRLGLEPKRATELATSFADALEHQPTHPLGTLLLLDEAAATLERAGFPDTTVCSGSAPCVSSLARVSGLARIVALQLVKVGSELAIDVSVVDASGRILGVVTRSVKLKTANDELSSLAAELISKLPPPADAPVEVKLTPPTPPPTVEVTPPPFPTGRKVALGLGGGAVVALGVGVGLGVSALGQSKALSPLDPQFENKAAAARGTALGADLTYGLAGALAVSALVAWLISPP